MSEDLGRSHYGPLRSTRIIELLIQKGANINHRNLVGDTPLIYGAKHGTFKTIKILLKNGADPTTRNNLGKTALDIAVSSGNYYCA